MFLAQHFPNFFTITFLQICGESVKPETQLDFKTVFKMLLKSSQLYGTSIGLANNISHMKEAINTKLASD
jgi:hypothetical protein